MEHSPRRQHVIREFGKHKIDFEFINAVVGKKIDLRNDPRVNYSAVEKYPGWLTHGMIGCALSHIYCYNKIIEKGLDFAIIFEDDIILDEMINDIIENVKKMVFPDAVTMLYYQSFNDIILEKKSFKNITGEYSIADALPDQTLISTAAYVIGKNVAGKMINYLLPVHTSPDSWKEFRDNKLLDKIYLVHPIPVYNACFQTEIQHNVKLKHRIIEALGRVLNKIPIQFIQKLLIKRRRRMIDSLQRIKVQ
jgi:glycosyl transferase family 25